MLKKARAEGSTLDNSAIFMTSFIFYEVVLLSLMVGYNQWRVRSFSKRGRGNFFKEKTSTSCCERRRCEIFRFLQIVFDFKKSFRKSKFKKTIKKIPVSQ